MLAMPFCLAATAVAAQSQAHNDARGYAEILGKSVWCDISREDRQDYERLALNAIAAASFNEPETEAAQKMFKTLVGETARAGARGDCATVLDSFKKSHDALNSMDMTPRQNPLPQTPDEQRT
jgi:hypothetical protein